MTKARTVAVCVLILRRGCVRLIAGSNSRRREAARPARFDSRGHGDQIEAQPPLKTMGPYVVEPPDVLLVEVLDALPGRPIEGEHVVRPDGTILAGFLRRTLRRGAHSQ